MNSNYAVIMAGGVGSRFWPMSTRNMPKQFLDVMGCGETLIQQTFRRIKSVCPVDNIYIVTNLDYKDTCLFQIPELNESNVLCEPVRRNTAPCIAYASYKIFAKDNNARMIVLPSDHLILNENEFVNTMMLCLEKSEKKNSLITLGINPTGPETGYGYIQYLPEENVGMSLIRKVKTFTEKPDRKTAIKFISSGDFLWNSGIFIWRAKSIISAIKYYLSDMHEIFHEGIDLYNTNNESNFINRVFPMCKNISIDYGVLEKSMDVYVCPSKFGWSDIGTWGSLSNHIEKDINNNSQTSKSIHFYDSINNIVRVSRDKLCVIQGLDGYIVVETDKVLLICKKQDEQNVKDIVKDLSLQYGEEYV